MSSTATHGVERFMSYGVWHLEDKSLLFMYELLSISLGRGRIIKKPKMKISYTIAGKTGRWRYMDTSTSDGMNIEASYNYLNHYKVRIKWYNLKDMVILDLIDMI